MEKPVKTSVKMKHIYWLIKSWIFWNVKDEKWWNVIDSKQVTWNGSLYYHLVKQTVLNSIKCITIMTLERTIKHQYLKKCMFV